MRKLIEARLLSRRLKKYTEEAQKISAIADQLKSVPTGTLEQKFSNLYGKTDRESMQLGFAVIVEMSHRTLGLRPYLVQIIGALVMSDGHIAEMATGEGKTLTAAMPLAWHGLQDRAHAMTVNDYLARRDAETLAPLYQSLGLSVNFLQNDMGHETRQLSHQSNIVYGTPSQFVFDYLRDHVTYSRDNLLHQGRHYVMVDEADSIFIDEARTPMILSGEGELDQGLWQQMYAFIATLQHKEVGQDRRTQLEKIIIDMEHVDSDIAVNTAEQQAVLTEQGTEKIEAFLVAQGLINHPKELWQTGKSHLWRIVTACVRACHLFKLNRDYLNRDGKIIIIDQETGRLSHGRRWSDGLHQAIEAKEGVEIRPESKDLGRVALANYLALYECVSGMTGTAMTEAEEIQDLYGLQVVPVPTHRPRQRIDFPDVVFMTRDAKLQQIAEDVKVIHATGQPILIGTGSVEDSEQLSRMFVEQGIPHRVLNAKQDAGEALIVAQAGRLGSITIATSMAGRGTDILLGGNQDIIKQYTEEQLQELNITAPLEGEREQVLAAGGLCVIGCERLDSPRLDLQLAGRSGRQGDPGSARFYVALNDPLMKDFGGEMLSNMFRRMGVGESDGLEHPMITRAIAQAQSRKQSLYVASRKQGLKQDSVIDKPRKVFFGLRNNILMAENDQVLNVIADQVPGAMAQLITVYLNNGKGFEEEWDVTSFTGKFAEWGMSKSWFENLYADFVKNGYNAVVYAERLTEWISFDLRARLNQFAEASEDITRQCMLMAIDRQWQIFLDESEQIRNGIHLRAYAQEKPEQAFQKEIFKLFNGLYDDLPVVILDFAYRVIMERERSMDEQHAELEPAVDGVTELEFDQAQDLVDGLSSDEDGPEKKPNPDAAA